MRQKGYSSVPAAEQALFRQNLAYARDLVATAVALTSQLTAVISVDDLLRSALVHGVSAFDHFVHEEVRVRMILTQQGLCPPAKGYMRFRVSMSSVDLALTQGGVGWLEAEIREQHGYLAFQQPEKVADAFRLVTDVSLWQNVAAHIQRRPDDVKRELKLIVDRRNKIAHEADTDPTPPRSRYPINEQLVTRSLDFLDTVVSAIIAVT
jgi:hypothetical protein